MVLHILLSFFLLILYSYKTPHTGNILKYILDVLTNANIDLPLRLNSNLQWNSTYKSLVQHAVVLFSLVVSISQVMKTVFDRPHHAPPRFDKNDHRKTLVPKLLSISLPCSEEGIHNENHRPKTLHLNA